MAFLEFGTAEGLAVKHDFYRDLELKMKVEQDHRKELADAEARAMLIGGLFKKGATYDSFNSKMVNKMMEESIEKAGRMLSAPGAKQDPLIWAQIQSMTQSMLDNEYTQASARLKQQNELIQDAMKKDPSIVKRKAFQEQLEAYKREYETGSSDGNPANRIPFYYQNVEGYKDVVNEMLKIGGAIEQYDFKQIEGGLPGSYIGVPNEESIRNLAQWYYSLNKEQFDNEYHKMEFVMPDGQIKSGFTSPIEAVYNGIKAGAKMKFDIGDAKVLKNRLPNGGYASSASNPWQYVIDNPTGSFGSPDVQKKLFGEKANVFAISRNGNYARFNQPEIREFYWGAGYGISQSKERGTVDWEPDFVTIPIKQNDGSYSMTKAARATITIDPYVAKHRGILLGYDNPRGNRIADEYQGLAKLIKDKDKNEVVEITTYYPFDPIKDQRHYSALYENVLGLPKDYQTGGLGIRQDIKRIGSGFATGNGRKVYITNELTNDKKEFKAYYEDTNEPYNF